MKKSENIEQTEIRQMLLASAFKLYYSDMCIMSARLGMILEALQGKETEHFRGILTENYVAIALKTNGYDLHYWESDNTAEVDFLIQKDRDDVMDIKKTIRNSFDESKVEGATIYEVFLFAWIRTKTRQLG